MRFLRRLVQRFRLEQARPGRPVRPGRRVKPGRQIRPDLRDRLAAYNTYDARAFLSQLLARVARGEEIVIARAGTPVAKLVPYAGERLRPGVIRTHVLVIPKDDAGH